MQNKQKWTLLPNLQLPWDGRPMAQPPCHCLQIHIDDVAIPFQLNSALDIGIHHIWASTKWTDTTSHLLPPVDLCRSCCEPTQANKFLQSIQLNGIFMEISQLLPNLTLIPNMVKLPSRVKKKAKRTKVRGTEEGICSNGVEGGGRSTTNHS